MDDWRRTLVDVETRTRDHNEWIEWANDTFDPRSEYEFLCECSDERCTSTISASREAYEEVRASPVSFLLAPNHENPELDEVVVENAVFAVIKKLPGGPARLARETDPRA